VLFFLTGGRKFLGCKFDKRAGLHYHHDPARAGITFMPFTKVILTAKVANLGAEADIVRVRNGYARNYLLPRGFAMENSKAAEKRLNALKAQRAEREAKELNESEDLARKINKLKITLDLATGEQGKAFGSITAADLAEKIKSELGGKIEIDRHKIVLEHTIKTGGEHEVTIKLHHDVTATLHVTVRTGAAGEAPAPAHEAAEEKPEGGFKAKVKAKHSK
jgi:large subunit ribosomal protein L9